MFGAKEKNMPRRRSSAWAGERRQPDIFRAEEGNVYPEHQHFIRRGSVGDSITATLFGTPAPQWSVVGRRLGVLVMILFALGCAIPFFYPVGWTDEAKFRRLSATDELAQAMLKEDEIAITNAAGPAALGGVGVRVVENLSADYWHQIDESCVLGRHLNHLVVDINKDSGQISPGEMTVCMFLERKLTEFKRDLEDFKEAVKKALKDTPTLALIRRLRLIRLSKGWNLPQFKVRAEISFVQLALPSSTNKDTVAKHPWIAMRLSYQNNFDEFKDLGEFQNSKSEKFMFDESSEKPDGSFVYVLLSPSQHSMNDMIKAGNSSFTCLTSDWAVMETEFREHIRHLDAREAKVQFTDTTPFEDFDDAHYGIPIESPVYSAVYSRELHLDVPKESIKLIEHEAPDPTTCSMFNRRMVFDDASPTEKEKSVFLCDKLKEEEGIMLQIFGFNFFQSETVKLQGSLTVASREKPYNRHITLSGESLE
eukprot:GHVT01009270.1.p1 GENE.GHVT01009270.1~~GHVT01009270.1.p1  ORF type:complete len:480 (+),score=50.08 GHVT01009270.1:248-1687(+)